MIVKISRSYSITLDQLRRLLTDVPTDRMADQPHGLVNHPAWTLGHLVYAAQELGVEFGLPTWLPMTWAHRFGTGSMPIAEVTQYPTKSLLLDALTDAQKRVLDRLTEIAEAGLKQPLPDVRQRERYPTLGHATLHLLTVHPALHVGQIIAWRRVAGFGPVRPMD